MKNRDLTSGIFWMGFGAVFAVGGLQQGLVRQGIPGPGSLPFIVGVISIGLSLVLVIQSLTRKSAPSKGFFPQESSLRKLILTFVSIVGYGFLLKSFGFPLTTFLFLLFVLAFIGKERWFTALSFSLLTTVFSYLLFTALQVELPKGFLRM